MRTARALDDVLASRSHTRILRALDALPDGVGMSVRDLARRAEVTHPRASQVLSSLTQLGLTSLQRAGRADLYQLNRSHLLYGLVHEIFRQEAGVDAELESYLRKRLLVLVKTVQEAYLSSVVLLVVRPGRAATSTLQLSFRPPAPAPLRRRRSISPMRCAAVSAAT